MAKANKSRRGKAIDIEGLDQLFAKLSDLPDVIAAGSRRAVHDETEQVADDMREAAPVDTGELKESIQAEHDEKRIVGRAVATARHATFVEHGTSSTPAQPFVDPAVIESRRRFPKRVHDYVNEELTKSGVKR